MADQSPLAGKHIVVTRARHQAPPLEALIREFGAVPLAYPCVEIELPGRSSALDVHLRDLDNFDWIAFSSSNAVWAVAARARSMQVDMETGCIKLAALGPATATELQRRLARRADFMPESFSAEGLARQLPVQKGDRVLLPQSDLADQNAAEVMRSRGAIVTAPIAYRTVVGRGGVNLPKLIAQDKIDALSFASPSAVRFFRRRCPIEAALRLPVVCLGPATAKAAYEHNFQTPITPTGISLRAMISALSDYFAAR